MALAIGLLGAAPPGFEALTAGDDAWDAGLRADARRHWLEAADSAHPAVGAMAEARLLQVSGTPGLIVHGPRLDAHLARCPAAQPWCGLARVDAQLFQTRVGLPGRLDDAQTWLAALETAPALPEDAVLVGAVARRRQWLGGTGAAPRPPVLGPGTWVVGVAPFGATGLGAGGAVVFSSPDVAHRGGRMHATVGATLGGSVRGLAAYDSPGRVWGHGLLQAGRYQGVVLAEAAPETRWSWRTLTATAGPGLRGEAGSIWVGPTLLMDEAPGTSRTTSGGGALGLDVGRSRWRTSVDAQAVGGDYTLATGTAHLVLRTASARALGRLSVAPTVASAEGPLWRTPGWGGGVVLRHGSWQSLRSPVLAGAVAELRARPIGRFEAGVFAEAAVGDRLVGGVGTGLAVQLPPSPRDVLRVDVAWGSLGLGVSTGWGRFF